MNYYNDNDPSSVAWLMNLISAGHLPEGDVSGQDIKEVRAENLFVYKQCHFFAGIGGWSLALRYAGWPKDRRVWTGSCPCQPFSQAGKGRGTTDDRHLWPYWFKLIAQCRPPTIFGEQVEAAIRHGWLDAVQDDLESIGYSVGAVVLPACSVGAPHIRHRLFWVADCHSNGRNTPSSTRLYDTQHHAESCGSRLGDTNDERPQGHAGHGDRATGWQEQTGSTAAPGWADVEWRTDRNGITRPLEPGLEPLAHGVPKRLERLLRGYGNAIVPQVATEFIKTFMEIE